MNRGTNINRWKITNINRWKITNINRRKKTIFISWSGNNSRIIAEQLKNTLLEVFSDDGIQCFVSTQDIAAGDDWYTTIRQQLKGAAQGILCITSDNIRAPWLNFEAGALVGYDLKVIPLLFNCKTDALASSPLNSKNAVEFDSDNGFCKMLGDIREELALLKSFSKEKQKDIYQAAYKRLRDSIQPVLTSLNSQICYSDKSIYPEGINAMTKGTVYISAPMKTLLEDNRDKNENQSDEEREREREKREREYKEQQSFLKKLAQFLKDKKGICDVFCPAMEVESYRWDTAPTAVENNYTKLKMAQYLFLIYPKPIPTSALVEIGYGIALCKNVVIFYEEHIHLPYMLDKTNQDIPHLHTYPYSSYNDIIEHLRSEKKLFQGVIDE